MHHASLDIWKMLAGVAFFLLAMSYLENVLGLLAGRGFKLFLKKQTRSKVKAIGGAALITGLLQSSSVVNLLVLSMVGAGVVKMENALALILGANLGTTFDSWVVATLGFNYNIESLVWPVVGVAGIGMAFFNKGTKWFLWFKFLFSLAFLFIALGFIKAGMEEFVRQTDLAAYSKFPLIIFTILGLFLTSIIQSSSATIAITLSALYAKGIELDAAAAVVLGSEIGTTLKLFLASAKGIAAKKRIALGNFLFNVITVIVIFFFLRPIMQLITQGFQIKNNLIALVFFQSFINLVCIILFFPALKLFGQYLSSLYRRDEEGSSFISKVAPSETEHAMQALEKEARYFIGDVVAYALESFNINLSPGATINLHKSYLDKPDHEKYPFIKQLFGEMHGFCLKLQQLPGSNTQGERINQLISATRNTMYAAKNIRDIQQDIQQTRNSSNEIKFRFYTESREKLEAFYQKVVFMLNRNEDSNSFETLALLYHSVTEGYAENLQLLYREQLVNRVSQTEISTLINFNRELYTSLKSIIFGLKDYLLTTKETDYFDSLPGFIR